MENWLNKVGGSHKLKHLSYIQFTQEEYFTRVSQKQI